MLVSLDRQEGKIRAMRVALAVLVTVCFVYSLSVQVFRILRGIEITDEAFYVAEVISVIRGNVPFAFNNISISGQTLIPLLPIYIFTLINPSLSGIVLFSRFLFLIFRIVILGIMYILLRKRHNKLCIAFFLSIIFCTWGGSTIHELSYNSIPFYLNLLIGTILLSAFESKNQRTMLISSCISGVLITFAVLSHKAVLFCPQKKIKNATVYYLAGIVTTLSIVLVLIICSSWGQLRIGFDSFWNHGVGLTTQTPAELWNLFCEPTRYGTEITVLWIALGVTLLNRVIRYFFHGREKADYILKNAIPTLLLFLLAYGIFAINREEKGRTINEHLGVIIGGMNLVLLLDSVINNKKETIKIQLLFFVPYLVWFIPTSFFTNGGPLHRTAYFWLSLFGTMLIYEPVLIRKKWLFKIVIATVFVCVALLGLRGLREYIYRDNSIEELTYQVETGVYQGLYTSEERGKATEELEDYLKANTTEEDKVLCLDTVPMAYLMVNGTHCTPSTWDRMQHSYEMKNRETSDEIMYRYFRNKGETPTIIIYVDFGRDGQLSIEEEDYPFNRFVNHYYALMEEKKIKELYRIKIYRPTNNGFMHERNIINRE